MPKEELFRVNGGEVVTLSRKVAYENTQFVVRPYTNKWYNCSGCRKRYNTNKHLLYGQNNSSSWGGTLVVYPKIPTCGSETCFNMILLKKGEKLKHYSNIRAVKVDEVADYIKCANCSLCTGPGYTNRTLERPFLQAYIDIDGKETKFKVFCCLDCFKIYVSEPL